MEYTKRVGRTTFRAQVQHDERGDWSIRSGAFQATLPLTAFEVEVWLSSGRALEPQGLPERVETFLGKVAGKVPVSRAPGRVKHEETNWMPLDGEESVSVYPVEKRTIRFGEPGEIVTGRVRCSSPRCREHRDGWLVVQLPGSRYDVAGIGERVEGISPADFAEQHRAWHREAFPTSPRVTLSEWIDRHKNVHAPELTEAERLELDLNLAIAADERRAKR